MFLIEATHLGVLLFSYGVPVLCGCLMLLPILKHFMDFVNSNDPVLVSRLRVREPPDACWLSLAFRSSVW